jgi:hypothetical protein
MAEVQGDELLPSKEKLLDFVTERNQILSVIIKCRTDDKCIAVSSPLLGDGFIITGVEEVIKGEGQIIIQLKHYDSTGYILPTNRINLTDIAAVCAFESKFKNPVLKNFDRPRSWFF